jgi:hypothetical protein
LTESSTPEQTNDVTPEVVDEPLPPPPGGFCPLGDQPQGLKETAAALLNSAISKNPQRFSLRSLSDSSSVSGSSSAVHNPYRRYVEKLLKTLGLKKTLNQMKKIFTDSVGKVYDALPYDIDYKALMDDLDSPGFGV